MGDGDGDGAGGFPANRLRRPLNSSLVDTRGFFSMSNQNLGGLPVAGELLLSSSVASGLLISGCGPSPLGRGDRRSIGNEGIVRGTRQASVTAVSSNGSQTPFPDCRHSHGPATCRCWRGCCQHPEPILICSTLTRERTTFRARQRDQTSRL